MVEPIKRTVRIDDDQSVDDSNQEYILVRDNEGIETLSKILKRLDEIAFHLKTITGEEYE